MHFPNLDRQIHRCNTVLHEHLQSTHLVRYYLKGIEGALAMLNVKVAKNYLKSANA
jgi:hypothetical protein